MVGKKQYSIIFIVFSTLLITGLHYVIPQARTHPTILEELYYMPIFAGAIIFGMKGALLVFSLASASYLPFFFGPWVGPSPLDLLDRLLHVAFTAAFAVFAGFLIERDRRRREELGKERYLAGVGRAAAEIIHDLKSPLLAVSGFAKRIKEGRTDPSRGAEIIMEAAQAMEKTTLDILAFARPAELNIKDEEVADVLGRVHDTCSEKARRLGIRLSLDLPESRLIASMDSSQIQRALINLVDNAIDASGEGETVTVTVRAKGKHLVLDVVDHGSGMDTETLESLFTPFFSKKSHGTGLGLASAKKMVDLHRGTIFVKSSQGIGTKVTIRLPLVQTGSTQEESV